MVFLVGAQHSIGNVSVKTWTFLILSGLATGASWLCYFRALQIGDVDKVVPVDKSSAILSILLAFIFLHESISPLKLLCVVLIGVGTYLMITKKGTSSENSGQKRLALVLLCTRLCCLCQPDFYSGKSRH